jgi:hypothetical protein
MYVWIYEYVPTFPVFVVCSVGRGPVMCRLPPKKFNHMAECLIFFICNSELNHQLENEITIEKEKSGDNCKITDYNLNLSQNIIRVLVGKVHSGKGQMLSA